MSRGPGKIERAIEAVFATECDDAFTTEDLVDRIYAGENGAQKKQRVAMMRAAKNVCGRLEAWTWWRSASRGGALVFLNRYSVMSYATARLKAADFPPYRHKDMRTPAHWCATPESIRAELSPGGRRYDMVVEGGPWWRHVQLNIAKRDGDVSERALAIRAEQERRNELAQAAKRSLVAMLSR